MSLIDSDSLLQPIAGPDPAGINLEYDRAFAALERSVQGKPEQQIGEAVVPGEPPDWKGVEGQAAALLARSKDLRIVSHLIRALLHRYGFAGLDEGLGLLRKMLEQFWGPIHPQLDPDDGNDPTMRVNALAVLADTETMNALRAAPLVRSRSFGPISLRDIAVATGEIPPAAGAQKVEMTSIEAAFQDCTVPDLAAIANALHSAAENVKAIDTYFSETAGVSGPDMTGFVRLIRQATQFVQPRLQARSGDAAATDGTPAADGSSPTVNGTGGSMGTPLSGDIRSRDDVVRALDKICAYYERQEPSSPLPLLLHRCKRLATMNFLEIMREMVPAGLDQIEVIAGKREESS